MKSICLTFNSCVRYSSSSKILSTFLNLGLPQKCAEAQKVHLAILDGTYSFNATHTTHADIAASIVAVDELVLQPAANGFADASSAVFERITHPSAVQYAVILFEKIQPDLSDAELVAFYDVVTGFPFTPTGGTYVVSPDVTFGGYFRL